MHSSRPTITARAVATLAALLALAPILVLTPTTALASAPGRSLMSASPVLHIASPRPLRHHWSSLACVNNDCPTDVGPLTDGGGPMITTPVIYSVLFSDSTTSLSPATGFSAGVLPGTTPNIAGAISATVNAPYATWWMNEYSRPSQPLNYGSYAGTITLYNPTLADQSSISAVAIQDALYAAESAGTITPTPNTLYVAFFRSGQVITDGTQTSNNAFCGYHDAVLSSLPTINYAVIPNEDAQPACDYVSPTSTFENLSAVVSHEVAESVTDPSSPAAWMATGTNELADICETGVVVAGPVPYQGATYWLQYLYSNAAGGCYGLPLASHIALSLSGSLLTATLTAGSAPVANQPLSLGGATLTTDSLGTATFTVTPSPGTTYDVSFPGAGPLLASSATLSSPTHGLTLLAPSSVLAGHAFSLTATVAPAPANPATVTLVTPTSTLTATTDPSGVATFSLTAPLTTGVLSYTATALSAQASATVTVTAPTTLSLSASPSSATASSDTATTTVTLTAQLSSPDAGQSITFSGSGLSSTVPTDATGAATVTLNLLPGTYAFQAVTQMGVVALTANAGVVINPPTGSESLTLAAPSIVDPGSTFTLTATLTPAVPGLSVTVQGAAYESTAVTNANGVATFQLPAPPAGSYVYSASVTVSSATLSATVTVDSQPISSLSLVAPSRVAPGRPFTVRVGTTPAQSGLAVTVTDGLRTLHGVTGATGTASFTFIARAGTTSFIASAVLAGILVAADARVSAPSSHLSATANRVGSRYVIRVAVVPGLAHVLITLSGGSRLLMSHTDVHGHAIFVVPAAPHVYRVTAVLGTVQSVTLRV